MTTFTPADLTEGCLVSGTHGIFTFTDQPASKLATRGWGIGPDGVHVLCRYKENWAPWVTVTDIQQALKQGDGK